jgi:hypothetical protein
MRPPGRRGAQVMTREVPEVAAFRWFFFAFPDTLSVRPLGNQSALCT